MLLDQSCDPRQMNNTSTYKKDYSTLHNETKVTEDDRSAVITVRKPHDENLVSWAMSGEYDENAQILIDGDNPSRFLTRRKATALIEGLAGSFEPGNTICVHSYNDILYPVLVLAILASGCSWTGTNPACTSTELRHHLQSSKTTYVITPAEHLETVRSAISTCDRKIEIILLSDIATKSGPDVALEYGNAAYSETLHDLLRQERTLTFEQRLASIRERSPAAIFSTSGTTGFPKMVQRTHRELVMESKATEDANSLKPYEIRRLYCIPMFHAYSFTDMNINTLRLGLPSFYMRRFDDTFAQRLQDFSITETLVAPPILMRLVHRAKAQAEEAQKLQSLQTVICAGAPLSRELKSAFTQLFPRSVRLVQGWGMSEGGWFTTFRYPECDDSGSVGRLVAGYEIRMSEQAKMSVRDGLIASELLVRAPQMPRTYLDNPDATAEAFDEDGWLRTGDIGYVEDGKVYLVDRAKDMIKVNGWSVAPAELEAALYKSPLVHDAAVVGTGQGVEEHPILFIVPKDAATTSAEDITDHLRQFVARFKVAKCEVVFVSSIPRNPSGKILRKVLRQQHQEQQLQQQQMKLEHEHEREQKRNSLCSSELPAEEKGKFAGFRRKDLVYRTLAKHPFYASVLTPAKITSGEPTHRPVLVFWHGGGLITGDRMYEPWWPVWLLELARSQGAIIISADFRLLPEASGRDILDDVGAFWTWYSDTLPAIADSESWVARPDAKRTIVAGQSSGAVIAVHSALERPDVNIRAVLCLYGPLCFDIPLLNMARPRIIGGTRPPPPRQAEAKIRSYIARSAGSTRTTGDPAVDWELVCSIVQQGYLPRMAKKNHDPRLDFAAVLEAKRALPPTWVIHGEQDSVVPLECSTKFVNHVKKFVPEAPVLLSIQPGDHSFDVSMTVEQPWLSEGCTFVLRYW